MHGAEQRCGAGVADAPPATFEGIEDLEARLVARTKVPADRLTEYLRWSDSRIRREVALGGRVLKWFADAVVSSMEDEGGADAFLRSLDPKTVSREHDWRAIFRMLRDEPFDDDCKRAALVRYLQFLSFRKRLLEFIHDRRQGLEEDGGDADLTGCNGPAPRVARPGGGEEFTRLAHGETAEIDLRPGGAGLEVMLAAHLFRIVGGRTPSIIDQNGVTYFVKDGRNMVGRHPQSDVVVDQNFNDVSRAHLVIDWDPAGRVRLIDLSTRGTSVRRSVLASPRRCEDLVAGAPRAAQPRAPATE